MEQATAVCLVLVQLKALREKHLIPSDADQNDANLPQGWGLP